MALTEEQPKRVFPGGSVSAKTTELFSTAPACQRPPPPPLTTNHKALLWAQHMGSFSRRKSRESHWKEGEQMRIPFSWEHKEVGPWMTHSEAFQNWGRGDVSDQRKCSFLTLVCGVSGGRWQGWEEETGWSCQSLDHQIHHGLGTYMFANMAFPKWSTDRFCSLS